MVLKPVEVFVRRPLLVNIPTLLSLLLLDAFEKATVRCIIRQVPLVWLLGGEVDISRQIPLTFEVHALQGQSRLCIRHTHQAYVLLVWLAANQQAIRVTGLQLARGE